MPVKHPDRCAKGHDMTKETNIVWKKDDRYKGGYQRRCLTCDRAYHRERYWKRKAEEA